MKKFYRLLALLSVALLLFCGCKSTGRQSGGNSQVESNHPSSSQTSSFDESEVSSADVGSSEEEKEYVAYYFRNKSLKKSHYEKHGVEMGFENADDYEAAASRVINNPNALFKTEKEDGDFVYYIENTNEFVVLSADGYIRTYFWPSRGKAYFDRQ